MSGIDLWLCVALSLQLFFFSRSDGAIRRYDFLLTHTNITRVCKTHDLVTVNGMFPGPTITVRDGDTVVVNVQNNARFNASIHWHGILQTRNCWADGVAAVTQCPIPPGGMFTHRFRVSGQRGTLWWHAHYSWLRASVHGAFIIHPKESEGYPYPHPGREEVLVLGEWPIENPMKAVREMEETGGVAEIMPDSLLINAQPGDLIACSSQDTNRITVRQGERLLLRIINAAPSAVIFFKIANHNMTVVAADAQYTKPYHTNLVVLASGQTFDVLVAADQKCGTAHYVAADIFMSIFDVTLVKLHNTTATAILQYDCDNKSPLATSPAFPRLPYINDTQPINDFYSGLRSLNSPSYPSVVPQGQMDENLFYTAFPGKLPLNRPSDSSDSDSYRSATCLNNVSFVLPPISILEAHYFNIPGVYTTDFPDFPPFVFNFTDESLVSWYVQKGTRVKLLKYNSTVQLVMQGTGVMRGESHPFHLHGHDFFVVGRGLGIFDPVEDPKKFNLVDPPKFNTFDLPIDGWTAIRFVANNPGAWFFHCHIDWHLTTGMATVFVTEDGGSSEEKLPPPPLDYPLCHSNQLKLNGKSTSIQHPIA